MGSSLHNLNIRSRFAMKCFIFAAALLCLFALSKGQTCQTDADCGGQCCQILSEFQIVSRRAASRTGTCGTYKLEGAPCNSFDAINGYCSCAPGLQCKTYKDPNYTGPILASRKRGMLPGYISTCEKPTTTA